MRGIFPHLTYVILSMNSLSFWLHRTEIKHKNIVMAQAMLETMWLKCNNCSMTKKNNLFGFTNSKMIEFDHWTESVVFYKRWQEGYTGTTDEDYYQYLLTHWKAPNMDQYIKKLRWIVKRLNTVAVKK